MHHASSSNLDFCITRGTQFINKNQSTNENTNSNFVEDSGLSHSQSSLQLMIQAYNKIRSLEEDNEILRKHVELLTKDNQDLNQKLGHMHREKNSWLKEKQALFQKIKHLEIKLEGYMVKQHLYQMEKQSIGEISKQNARMTGNKQSTQKIRQEIEDKGRQKIAYQLSFKGFQNNFMQNKGDFQLNQSMISFSGEKTDEQIDLKKNVSCDVLNRQEKSGEYTHLQINRAINYPARNYSYQTLPIYNQDLASRQIFTLKSPQQQEYIRLGVCRGQRFSLSQSKPARSNGTPLIRKNSHKTKTVNEFQFQPQKNKTVWVSSQNRESKKFNYTNWRKANNNFMVSQGKSNGIVIKR